MQRKKVNKQAVEGCVKYIAFSGEYKIMDYLKDEGLLKGVDAGGRNTKMICPFHPEKTPSMYIDEENNQFFCQSCGRGGRYLQMVKFVKTIVQGQTVNFYSMLNNMLVNDVKMQLQTSYNTIYEIDRGSLEDVRDFRMKKFTRPTSAVIEDLGDLRREMELRGKMSIEEIRLACLFVQDGYSASETLNALEQNGQFETQVDMSGVNLNELFDQLELDMGEY